MTWSTWLRDASSGTTPPKRRCSSICVATTSESTRLPSSTTEAAVSSQEVSMPSTRTAESPTRSAELLQGLADVRGELALGIELQVALVGAHGRVSVARHLGRHPEE